MQAWPDAILVDICTLVGVMQLMKNVKGWEIFNGRSKRVSETVEQLKLIPIDRSVTYVHIW